MADDGTSRNRDKRELAHERTDLSEDRTIMAVERTFAGWMRTAFAAIGIGLGFRALFGGLDPPWLARAIATLFMILAIGVAIGAERRACRALGRMSSHNVDSPAMPSLRWIAWSVAAGAALVIVGLWLMVKAD